MPTANYNSMYLKYFLPVILSLIFLNCGHEPNSESKNANENSSFVKIEVVNTLPKLEDPSQFLNVIKTKATKDRVYFLEHFNNAIYEYDHQGNFIKQISETGRGPGQLGRPLGLSIEDSLLYTFEQGKMLIQAFNFDGSLEKSIFLTGSYEDIYVYRNKIYLENFFFGGMPDFIDMPNMEGRPQYSVYNIDSDELISFGRKLEIVEKLGITSYDRMIQVYNNFIYVTYGGFPIINKFSMNHELVDSYFLQDNDLKQYYDFNFEDKLEDSEKSRQFMDFKINEYGMFFAKFGTDLELYHFDIDGNFISKITLNDYINNEKNFGYIRNFDMIVDSTNNKIKGFFTLQGPETESVILDMYLRD